MQVLLVQCLSHACACGLKGGHQGRPSVVGRDLPLLLKPEAFTGCINCPAVVGVYENHFLPCRKLLSLAAALAGTDTAVLSPLLGDTFSPASLPLG